MTERADQLHHDHNGLPILQLSCRLFSGKPSHHPGLSALLQSRFGYLLLLAFPTAKISVARKKICKRDGHTVHEFSQWCLTADWLAPRDSDYSRMRSKVSSDCLPSYIKATRSVLEVFKMPELFPDSPRILNGNETQGESSKLHVWLKSRERKMANGKIYLSLIGNVSGPSSVRTI
jgi:hypothetical protein